MTTYRGWREVYPNRRGVRTVVTVDGAPFRPPANVASIGFEWGYTGAGPACLSHALLLHATGDPRLAALLNEWFMRNVVATWGERWQITGAEIEQWIERIDRDLADAPTVVAEMPPPRSCRVCGCTNGDCTGCITATGMPCHWVEQDLCSRCADVLYPLIDADTKEGTR